MNFAVKYLTRKVCPVLMARPSIKAVVSKAGGSVTYYTQCRTGSSYYSKFDAVITETASHCSPVVIILGWNGSKEKHLKKYSKIFEEKDFCTICVPAKPFNTFLRAGTKVKQISLHILDVLSDLNGQERPVFLYAFSNGGCAMFFHMMEAVSYSTRPSYQRVPIVGTIFDSCPIRPDFNSLEATKESVVDMIRSPVLKSILWHSMGIIIPAVLLFNSTVKRYMSGLTESPLQCPQLLLYSKADKLAPYQDIENYSQARKERGIFVVSKCWERSKHVNHYREHTAEYLDALNYFIEHCLTTYESTKSDLVEKAVSQK